MIKIIFIDKSIDKCIYLKKLFNNYNNVIFDYESDLNDIENINFDFYDICIYNINNYKNEITMYNNITYVAFDDYTYNKDDQYIKYIMDSGFDMYITNNLDTKIINHMLLIYKFINNNKKLNNQ